MSVNGGNVMGTDNSLAAAGREQDSFFFFGAILPSPCLKLFITEVSDPITDRKGGTLETYPTFRF